jgi:ABC-type Mn2+/Zn2+ transport system permease subunit
MDWSSMIIEPFSHPFMRDAMLMAILIAFLCGSLGVLLVPRGLSMVGDGLAHATLGGVGGALVLGLTPEASIWAAMPFAVLVAWGISWLGRHAKLAGDAALGVFFAVSLAAGVAAIHTASRAGVNVDMEGLLFGNILAVQPRDVRIVSILAVVCILILLRFGPRIAYAGFYPEMAALSGIRVERKEYLLMTLTAVVTVTAVHAVGVLLVSAYLVIPTVTARSISRRLGPMTLATILTGAIGSAIGLIMSYHFDIPTGAAMTLALGGCFLVALGLRGLGFSK